MALGNTILFFPKLTGVASVHYYDFGATNPFISNGISENIILAGYITGKNHFVGFYNGDLADLSYANIEDGSAAGEWYYIRQNITYYFLPRPIPIGEWRYIVAVAETGKNDVGIILGVTDAHNMPSTDRVITLTEYT